MFGATYSKTTHIHYLSKIPMQLGILSVHVYGNNPKCSTDLCINLCCDFIYNSKTLNILKEKIRNFQQQGNRKGVCV